MVEFYVTIHVEILEQKGVFFFCKKWVMLLMMKWLPKKSAQPSTRHASLLISCWWCEGLMWKFLSKILCSTLMSACAKDVFVLYKIYSLKKTLDGGSSRHMLTKHVKNMAHICIQLRSSYKAQNTYNLHKAIIKHVSRERFNAKSHTRLFLPGRKLFYILCSWHLLIFVWICRRNRWFPLVRNHETHK